MATTGNTLFYGDNLDVLRRHVPDESVDLIYLDPPFNSSRDYNILYKEESGLDSEAQIKAFTDTWHWHEQIYHDLMASSKTQDHVRSMIESLVQFIGRNQLTAYLVMMTPRLVELHRVLKPTGSIYLHCDPAASHYLKILMDTIFGPRQFRNEIIWRRTGSHGPRRSFGPIHDVIFFYSKTDKYYFKTVKRPYMLGHAEHRYTKDATGKFKFTSGGNVLTGAGITKGESGKPWHGFDPSAKNRHWAIPGFLTEQMPPGFAQLGVLAKLDALYKAGLVEIKEGAAWPTPVRYLNSHDGQPLQDIWAYQPYTEGTVYGTNEGIDKDASWLGPTDPERTGYQTQKPLGLLERIIRSSCPEGGIVLDPFCGCGTTVAAAHKLDRCWWGIDITYLSIALQISRLKAMFGEVQYDEVGIPKDYMGARRLAKKQPYQFQWWALPLVDALPIGGKEGSNEGKKGRDRGIDGIIPFQDDTTGKFKRILVQVKSGHVGSRDVRDLLGTVEREKAAMGVFITLARATPDMRLDADSAGFYHSSGWDKDYPKIQILTVKDLLGGVKVKRPHSTPLAMQVEHIFTHTQAPLGVDSL